MPSILFRNFMFKADQKKIISKINLWVLTLGN